MLKQFSIRFFFWPSLDMTNHLLVLLIGVSSASVSVFWIVLFSSVNKLFALAQPELALFLNYCVVAATLAFAFCSLVAKTWV